MVADGNGESGEPAGGLGALQTDVLAGRTHLASDLRMMNRAIREGWDIPQEKRPAVVERLLDIVAKTEVTMMGVDGPVTLTDKADTNAIQAARVLSGMSSHNLSDIHHQEKQGNDDERLKNERASVLLRAMTDQDWIDMAVQHGKVAQLPARLREMAEKQDARS